MLSDAAIQNPRPVPDLKEFAQKLTIEGIPVFIDNIETIVVPPLETADNIVRRMLKQVIVPIETGKIYNWELIVPYIDLYFRPLYVFQFERLDSDGNPIERKLEELDALHKNRWVNLETTEYQISSIPWAKILKLSADIGSIILRDVPILGTTMQIASKVADQAPEIVDEMKR
jgi:hypothetical protein